MNMKKKRGQSTVEYVLLMTAVVAVIIGFVATQKTGGFQDQMNSTLNSAVGQMGSLAEMLGNSHKAAPANATVQPASWYVNVAN